MSSVIVVGWAFGIIASLLFIGATVGMLCLTYLLYDLFFKDWRRH